MPRIVIVGGRYSGFYTAWKLEKKLCRGEAELTIIDPRPYMTDQPFLPEVVAGSIEARHSAISLRSHLRRTRIIAGRASMIDHANKTISVRPAAGPQFEVKYEIIVVMAGAVTRTLPIPGIADHAIGMKHVEEAVAIRDRLLTSFDKASLLPPGPERPCLLTVTFVGGGFSGVEGFAELLSMASAASLRGDAPRDYLHHSLGVVATLGLGRGIFQYRGIVITGFLAWVMHRGYHVLAIPTWERKVCVLAVWISAIFGGRDVVSLTAVQTPRAAFVAAGDPDAGE